MNSIKVKVIREAKLKRQRDGKQLYHITGINRDSQLCYLTSQKASVDFTAGKFLTLTNVRVNTSSTGIFADLNANSKVFLYYFTIIHML